MTLRALSLSFILSALACCGGAQSDAKTAAALVRVGTDAAEQTWFLAAQVCDATPNPVACAPTLVKVHADLLAVEQDIAAGNADLCELGSVANALNSVPGLVSPSVTSGVSALVTVLGSCPSDAGHE